MTSIILAAAVKGTVLLALAWAVTAWARKSSADFRHRVWLGALCGMALLLVPLSVPQAAQVNVVYTFTAESVATETASALTLPWLQIVWITGAALVLLRFLAGAERLRLWTRASQRTAVADVRLSGEISSLTWGVLQPSILLPAYAAEWSDEKRNMAIAHERAHIERRDWLSQSFAQVVSAIFWFHPLVWLAAAKLRSEAEQAVDDLVLASGAGAASYAEQLLEVARHLSRPAQIASVAMVRRPALSGRISAILDTTRIRSLAGPRSRVAIVVAAVCAAPILAAFQTRPSAFQPATPQPAPVARPSVPPAPQTPTVPQRAPRVMVAQAAPRPTPKPAPAVPTPTVEPAQVGNGVTAPKVIHRVEAVYSEEAREAKYQGEVWITAVIDENGIPNSLAVTQPLGLGLDEAAMEAVKGWRFEPGLKDGYPVPVKVTISVQFRLL